MKQVLLYSGGWDSYCTSFIYPQAKKLYINLHTPYSDKEIKRLPKDVEVQDIDLQRYVFDDGYHVPQRNAIMALIAAASVMRETEKEHDKNISVYICGVKEDKTAPDKNTAYFKKLSEFASSFDETKSYNIEVKGLFEYDKIDLWEKAGKPNMRNIISCYTGDNCGKCIACKRRMLYLDYIYPNEYNIDKINIINELEANDWVVSDKIKRRCDSV